MCVYVCVCVCVCVYVCVFINHKGKTKRGELKNKTLMRMKMKQLLKLVW